MSNSLITVATFSQPIEGHLVRARLETEGIPCFLADAHTISANWFYSNAIGGVKLQVRAADAQRARVLVEEELERHQSERDDIDWTAVDPDWTFDGSQADDDAHSCPTCGSTEVFYEKFSRPLIFLSILLLGIPVPFLSRRWSCRGCGRSWKMKLFR
jgi:hypothetical protein